MVAPADMEIGDVLAYLDRHQQKELLRFVAVGSVDDGKSTLIGRLLHDTHGIYEDQLRAVQRASRKVGTTGEKIDFALLTDGLRAEREQGITIDVAYRYFSTQKRKFIIADTPGHVQYTRNMATGASTADVALILIDARNGVQQQSRRHAYIASLLGIPYLAVCINKMDLVDFKDEAFRSIRRDFSAFANGLRFKEVRFVPVVAVDGDNVVRASERMPWYRGDTLLTFLETVPVDAGKNLDDFRFPVQYVLRPNLDYRGFSGQIASGVVRPGDEVVILPSGRRSRVAAVDGWQKELAEAFAPMSVTLRLTDEIDVSRGDMIVHPNDVPTVGRRFTAHVVWLSETPLDPARSYFLRHTTRTVRANVERVLGRLDLDSLVETPAERLELNDIGRLAFGCNQPIYFDPYTANRAAGAFVLVDAIGNNTVGAGMIIEALAEEDRAGDRKRASLVTGDERRTRLGHAALAIGFAGGPASGQAAVAYELERALFDRGVAATVIDVEALADGTRSPALFADLAAQCVDAGLVVILSTGLPRETEREQIRARLGDRLLIVAGNESAASVLATLEQRGDLPAG
jgi:sulfate adenylyltransferase large subunit